MKTGIFIFLLFNNSKALRHSIICYLLHGLPVLKLKVGRGWKPKSLTSNLPMLMTWFSHFHGRKGYMYVYGLPWWLRHKESTCNAGDMGATPGLGRSEGGHDNPPQYSCVENPHGQRSLAGYSPWGRKELDITEWLNREIWKLIFSLMPPSKSVFKTSIMSICFLLCSITNWWKEKMYKTQQMEKS